MSKQAKVLSGAEFKRVLAVAGATRLAKRNELMLCLAHWSGMRACELASLRLCDVRNEDGTIKDEVVLAAWQTKGSKRARLFLGLRTRKLIDAYINQRMKPNTVQTAPLLQSQKSKGLTTQAIINLFAKLYGDAGIAGASSHSGRRSFITNLVERGVNPRIIQVLARHSNLSATMRYMDVNDAKLKNAVELAA